MTDYKELIERLRRKANLTEHVHVAREFRAAADAIEELATYYDNLSVYYDRMAELPDCNDCAKKRDCEYLPEWGATTRVNCPLWVGERDSE